MSALPKTPQMYPTTVIVENGPQNPPESPNNNEGSQIFLVIMNIINSLTHMLLGCIVMSAFIYANVAGASTFKQHIYLCVFGVSLCFFWRNKDKNMRNRERYTNFKNNCCAIKELIPACLQSLHKLQYESCTINNIVQFRYHLLQVD